MNNKGYKRGRWSHEDLDKLREYKAVGLDDEHIAKLLKRRISSIEKKWSKMQEFRHSMLQFIDFGVMFNQSTKSKMKC